MRAPLGNDRDAGRLCVNTFARTMAGCLNEKGRHGLLQHPFFCQSTRITIMYTDTSD